MAEGVGDGDGGGVPLGVPDGEGAGEEADGEGLAASDGLAGTMRAAMEARAAAPGWLLAETGAVPDGKVNVAPSATLDAHAIVVTAPAVRPARTVRTVLFTCGRGPLASPPAPTGICPPCIDY
ncbi:MAG TPA: hypothetical protein VGI66_18030, partial [Streptosporangiaceae bacterium]